MGVVLTYTQEGGSDVRVEFEEGTTSVDLSNKLIRTIDLGPFSSCIQLQDIYMFYNRMRTISLAPLSSCPKLRLLNVKGNQLEAIDLAPLSFCTNLQELALTDNRLRAIDLAPLSSCADLRILFLGGNQLQDVDLAPLSRCKQLEVLYLSRNHLQRVDLAPLSSCDKLRSLTLDKNKLQAIDVAPLSSCSKMRDLLLDSNQLQTLDLNPLSSCVELRALHVRYNPIQFIDVTPLLSLESLGLDKEQQKISYSWLRMDAVMGHAHLIYQRPKQKYPWAFLRQVALHRGRDRRVQQDILYALGLADYGFIDRDLRRVLVSIPPDTPLPVVCKRVRQVLVKHITRAIREGGSTTGLTMDAHLKPPHLAENIEIVAATQSIVDLRTSELQKVQVGLRNGIADLRELYLTAYGYNILSALDMRLTIAEEELVRVREALNELGVELMSGKDTKSGVKMSRKLKKAIWWIVENRGRQWKDIPYP